VSNVINGTGGTITASNGVLNLTGTVASGQSFAIDTASASTLLFSGTATAANPISITDSHQTLEIGALGNLTINGAETITNGTIKLDGGTLVDVNGTTGLTVGSGGTLTGFGTAPNDITLAGGTVAQSGGVLTTVFITGFGTVNGVTGTTSPVTGATQIVASGGGTLDLIGTVSGSQLVVDGTKPGVANVLKVDGAVTGGGDGSIQITGTNSANQTVEIGAAGSLTLSKGQSIVGTIKLDGGNSALTDTSGLSVNGGALLIGSGLVNAGITGVSGSGNVVEASGGLLAMNGAVGGTGLTYEIANSAASVLEISAGGTTTGNFDFLGSAGELEFNGATAPIEDVAGLNVGASKTVPTNFVDFLNRGVTITDFTNAGSGTSGIFHLSDGTVLNLSAITNGSGTWYVDTLSVGSGTELFLSSVVCYAAGTRILTVTGERTV
jgi:large repetitive protein